MRFSLRHCCGFGTAGVLLFVIECVRCRSLIPNLDRLNVARAGKLSATDPGPRHERLFPPCPQIPSNVRIPTVTESTMTFSDPLINASRSFLRQPSLFSSPIVPVRSCSFFASPRTSIILLTSTARLVTDCIALTSSCNISNARDVNTPLGVDAPSGHISSRLPQSSSNLNFSGG
jgi:hypothetical protein